MTLTNGDKLRRPGRADTVLNFDTYSAVVEDTARTQGMFPGSPVQGRRWTRMAVVKITGAASPANFYPAVEVAWDSATNVYVTLSGGLTFDGTERTKVYSSSTLATGDIGIASQLVDTNGTGTIGEQWVMVRESNKASVTIGLTGSGRDYETDGTADDVQWQLAVNEAQQRAVPLVADSQTYTFASTVTVPAGLVQIISTSPVNSWTIRPSATGFDAFDCSEGAIFTAERMAVTQNGTTKFDNGIVANRAQLDLNHCTINYCTFDGIEITDSRITMSNSDCKLNGVHGVSLIGSFCEVREGEFSNNGTDGINGDTNSTVILNLCRFDNNTTNGLNAVWGMARGCFGTGGTGYVISITDGIVINCSGSSGGTGDIRAEYGSSNTGSRTVTDDADAGTAFNGDPNTLTNMTFTATGRLTSTA